MMGNNVVSAPEDMVSAFHSYFVESGPKLVASITNDDKRGDNSHMPTIESPCSVYLSSVTSDEDVKIIMSLKHATACEDDIKAEVLKSVSEIVSGI